MEIIGPAAGTANGPTGSWQTAGCGRDDARRDAASHPGFCASDVCDHSHLTSPSSETRRKSSAGDDLDTGGRFWHQPLTVSDESELSSRRSTQGKSWSSTLDPHVSISGHSRSPLRAWPDPELHVKSAEGASARHKVTFYPFDLISVSVFTPMSVLGLSLCSLMIKPLHLSVSAN